MFDPHEHTSPDNLHSSSARRMSPHERADAMLQEEKESRRRWEAALSPAWPDRARFVALYGEPAALIMDDCRAATRANDSNKLAIATRKLSRTLFVQCNWLFQIKQKGA